MYIYGLLYHTLWTYKGLIVVFFPIAISFTFIIMMDEIKSVFLQLPFPSANYISSIAKEIKDKHIHCTAAQQPSQNPKVKNDCR